MELQLQLQELGYGGLEVVEEEVSFVKPAGESGGHGYLYLSSLDLYWRGEPYSRRVLFYENVGDIQIQEAMVSKLKSSLAQLLLAFYPAAGRLVLSGGPSSGRPSILCDGQGAEFVVARVNAPLSHLHSSHFEPCPFFRSLARPYASPRLADPLLSIQVTKFRGGGLALGISYSNILADGHSMWHLMNSWAECARNEVISIPPCHNREAFKAKDLSRDVVGHFSLPSCNILTKEKFSPPTIVHKLLHVTPLMINKLKQRAHEQHNLPTKASFSDYDVLCALMWKSIIASQAVMKVDHSLTNLCVLGDMRFRMKPQLPRGYFGNGTIFAYASSYVKDIEEGSFGNIALKVHEACKVCNEPRLWTLVNWLQLHDNLFNEKSLPWMVTSLNVVSSPKFKVYNVDFGWGKPVAVRPIQILNTRDMVLLPGRDGGIDICISCSRPIVAQLLQNFKKLTS